MDAALPLRIEMALAKLLASWGIKPTACVGHSVGEFAAACVAASSHSKTG